MTMKSLSAHDVENIEDKKNYKRPTQLHKPTFGSHVYLSHPERNNFICHKTPQLKSSSTISVGTQPSSETNENTRNSKSPVFLNNFNITDSCTQTSKTILQLAQLESETLTPDSLTQSPRKPELLNKGNQFNVQELESHLMKCYINDGDVTNDCNAHTPFNHDDIPIAYCRKNSVRQYIDGCNLAQKIPPEEEYLPYPKKSLTETFLKKKIEEKSPSCTSRSTFLQQTSPLRNLSGKYPNTKENTFKSQSCVISQNSQYLHDCDFQYVPNKISRFTVKGVKEQQFTNAVPTIKRFWHVKEPKNSTVCNNFEYFDDNDVVTSHRSSTTSPSNRSNNSPNSSTFMSPTFASEQRNQAPKVQNLKHLISPTRRGRSLSSGRHFGTHDHIPSKVKTVNNAKIPYIDQSQSKFSVVEGVTPKRNTPVHPTILSMPLQTKLKFDEDLLKLDLQSLHGVSEDTAVDSSVQVSCSSSVTSNENAIMMIMNRIRNPDWNEALKGLAEMIELSRIMDREYLFPHMTAVNQKLLELLRSPRSHVCRIACQAAGHLFETMKDIRRPEFDDIVENLLCKTADANKFIRKDANLSLDCMVTHIPIQHAVRSLCLKGPSHKNALVRTATVRLIICAVVITGPSAVLSLGTLEHTRKRIINQLVKFATDKNLETRKFGERLYKILSKEAHFELCLRKYIDTDDITAMKMALKNKNKKR